MLFCKFIYFFVNSVKTLSKPCIYVILSYGNKAALHQLGMQAFVLRKGDNMLPQERYKLITDYLENHNIIKIEQMLDMFDISIETARRDLTYMEKQGLIKKIYGGATLVKREAGEPENSERLEKNNRKNCNCKKMCRFYQRWRYNTSRSRHNHTSGCKGDKNKKESYSNKQFHPYYQ